jgi:hypothetical protein
MVKPNKTIAVRLIYFKAVTPAIHQFQVTEKEWKTYFARLNPERRKFILSKVNMESMDSYIKKIEWAEQK